jgi:hypothetical protein
MSDCCPEHFAFFSRRRSKYKACCNLQKLCSSLPKRGKESRHLDLGENCLNDPSPAAAALKGRRGGPVHRTSLAKHHFRSNMYGNRCFMPIKRSGFDFVIFKGFIFESKNPQITQFAGPSEKQGKMTKPKKFTERQLSARPYSRHFSQKQRIRHFTHTCDFSIGSLCCLVFEPNYFKTGLVTTLIRFPNIVLSL